MKTESETVVLNSLESLPGGSAPVNPVVENAGGENQTEGGVLITDAQPDVQFRSHESAAAPAPVAPKRGRVPGMILAVTQRVATFINIFPNLKDKFRVKLEALRDRAPEEILKLLSEAIAAKTPLTPEYMAGLAQEDIGGIHSLSEVLALYGPQMEVTVPRKLWLEYHENLNLQAWAKLTAIDKGDGDLYTDATDPTMPDPAKMIEKLEKIIAERQAELALWETRRDEAELAKLEAAEKAEKEAAEKAESEAQAETETVE